MPVSSAAGSPRRNKKGVIPATATYRLPRDGYEWGYVAIFSLRKDGDPEPSVFPWGSDPLPWEPNVGNFGGGEVVVKSIPVPPIESDIRPKYRDDFPGLSPVGLVPSQCARYLRSGGQRLRVDHRGQVEGREGSFARRFLAAIRCLQTPA